MGFLGNARLIHRLARPDVALPASATGSAPRLAIPGNPWQLGSLNALVWNDLFEHVGLLTREQALQIPGVARGRSILASLLCDKPLVSYRGSDRLDPQPLWLYRSPGWQGPFQRMLGILDDHVFYGESLLGVKRGAASSGLKPILEAWHVPYELWEIDPAGRICVADEDGQMMPADEDEVIYIPAAHEGLLQYASRSMRGAIELEQSWIARARNPIPAIDLHETVDTGLEREERQVIVDDWAQARGDVNGAIASTPWNIEARVLGTIDPTLYIEGRNAVRLDLANFFAIPASLMDATTPSASLTYRTTASDQSAVDSMTIPYWARPIEDRLSQDDVVPAGQAVRFAWAQAYTEPPGPIVTGSGLAPVVDAAAQHVSEQLGRTITATEETPS